MPKTATLHVRVPFVDIDSSDRIHFTAMMRYWELAEHELMRAIGMPYATTLRKQAFPRVHVEADYLGAIAFDDQLDIEATIGAVGTTSWTILFTARATGSGQDDRPLATGKMVVVSMDQATGRPVPLDPLLKSALES